MPITSNNLMATTWNLYPARAIGATSTNWSKNKYFHNWNEGNPVKNYDTFEDGITATANTLKFGNYYPRIVAGIKADKTPEEILAGAGTEFEIWGTTKKLVSQVLKSIPVYSTDKNTKPAEKKKITQIPL